jgi:hypothetical protein
LDGIKNRRLHTQTAAQEIEAELIHAQTSPPGGVCKPFSGRKPAPKNALQVWRWYGITSMHSLSSYAKGKTKSEQV